MSIETIAERMRAQDNQCTADPMWVVYRKRKVVTPRDYSDLYEWYDHDGCRESDERETAILDRMEARGRNTGSWEKHYYQEVDEFVSVFFTDQAAKDFVAQNGHRYGSMRIFVDSGYRNPEWKEIRAWLAKQDIRYDAPHILPLEWYAKNANDPMKILQHLLCIVNTITAPHRHGNPIPKSRLDEICEVQLRIEEAIRGEK